MASEISVFCVCVGLGIPTSLAQICQRMKGQKSFDYGLKSLPYTMHTKVEEKTRAILLADELGCGATGFCEDGCGRREITTSEAVQDRCSTPQDPQEYRYLMAVNSREHG
ncbi:hypothetical protein GHT06_013524 [Daphnia sinensis]|uniref:Uncharacterized protein n=1 Tax=Daphnia sinensis TaxID=1820382 RepID=A0AAD5KSC3_9CRUS|nr:hypothetical protein GHT06_013524 [Daphnia sinensis]